MPYNILVNKEKGHEAYLNGVAKIRTDHRDGGYCYWVPEGSGGGQEVQSGGDVIFYDYDGAIVASYSADDFLELSSMPDNPSHEGLTAQGWNWSLSDAKEYVRKYRMLNIGQMYITTDGKTHIRIHLEKERTRPMLGVCPNGTVDVDWGDGTAHDTLTGTSETEVRWTQNHEYSAPGDYVIKLAVTGSMGFYGVNSSNQYSGILRFSAGSDGRNYAYRNAVIEVNIGANIPAVAQNAFDRCYELKAVTLPKSITSICSSAFCYCYRLIGIVIPNTITTIAMTTFYYCTNLSFVAIPNSVTSIEGSAFGSCCGLRNVSISDNIITIGDSAFSFCHSLVNIVLPNSITAIDDAAFAECHSLTKITIPTGIEYIGAQTFRKCYCISEVVIPTGIYRIKIQAFDGCYSLKNVYMADDVTVIDFSAFSNCHSLTNIRMSNGLTSIDGNIFMYCYSLLNITIPEGITSFASNMFYACYSLKEIHFKATTPLYAQSRSWYRDVPTDCIIYVPTGSLSAYTSAANYPDPSVYTYIEE